MRATIPATAAAVTLMFLSIAAVAQQPAATKENLQNDPKVQQSQDPQPKAEGTRSPKTMPSDEGQVSRALDEAKQKPVDINGNPTASAGSSQQPTK